MGHFCIWSATLGTVALILAERLNVIAGGAYYADLFIQSAAVLALLGAGCLGTSVVATIDRLVYWLDSATHGRVQ